MRGLSGPDKSNGWGDASAIGVMGPICHDRQYLFFTQRQRLSLLAIRRSWQLEQNANRLQQVRTHKIISLILALVNSVSLHEIAKKPQCLLRNTGLSLRRPNF